MVSLPRHGDIGDDLRKRHLELLNDFAELFDNVYVINLFDYAPVYDSEIIDNFYLLGHMSPTGYLFTARMIESYIDYIIRKNPKDFAKVGLIGTDLYDKE